MRCGRRWIEQGVVAVAMLLVVGMRVKHKDAPGVGRVASVGCLAFSGLRSVEVHWEAGGIAVYVATDDATYNRVCDLEIV